MKFPANNDDFVQDSDITMPSWVFVPSSLQKIVREALRKWFMHSISMGSWFSPESTCILIPGSSAVSAKTPQNLLSLSTTIVWGKLERVHIFMMAEANALAFFSLVGLAIDKVVILEQAMR